MGKLKALWQSLPHQVQAVITAFVTGFLAAVGHALSEPGIGFNCFIQWECLKHYLPTFVAAGIAAARVFYMVPHSNGKP